MFIIYEPLILRYGALFCGSLLLGDLNSSYLAGMPDATRLFPTRESYSGSRDILALIILDFDQSLQRVRTLLLS